MPQYTANVNKSVQAAAEYLENEIVSSSMSTELLDKYSLDAENGKSCVIMVFEKYYMRNSSRISLTISIDDLNQYNACMRYCIGWRRRRIVSI